MENVISDIANTTFQVNSQHDVEVAHIINPFEFYIIPVKFKDFLKIIELDVRRKRPVTIDINDIIIFKMTLSKKKVFTRGQIIYIHNENNVAKFTIFAIDHGSTSVNVPKRKIWECNEIYINVAPVAKVCQLAFCFPINTDTWPRDSIKAFEYFVRNERFTMTIKGILNEKLLIQLQGNHPLDIATLMANTEFSSQGNFENTH